MKRRIHRLLYLVFWISSLSATNYSLKRSNGSLDSAIIELMTTPMSAANFGKKYTFTPATNTPLGKLSSSNSFSVEGSYSIALTIMHSDIKNIFPVGTIAANISLKNTGSSLILRPLPGKSIRMAGTMSLQDNTILQIHGGKDSVVNLGKVAVQKGTISVLGGGLTLSQPWTESGGVLDIPETAGPVIIQEAISAATLKAGRSIAIVQPGGWMTTLSAAIVDHPQGGQGAISIQGDRTGTVNMTGPNTYSGPTNILSGILKLSNTQVLKNQVTIENAATLELAQPIDVVHKCDLSGAGWLVKRGLNKITLQGDVSRFTGGLRIYQGSLEWSMPETPIAYHGLNFPMLFCGADATLAIHSSVGTIAMPVSYAGNITKLNSSVKNTHFIKTGPGALQLKGDSLNLDNVHIEDGTLIVRSANWPFSRVTIAPLSTCAIQTNPNVINNLAGIFRGEGRLYLFGGGGLSLNQTQEHTGTTEIADATLYYGGHNVLAASTNVFLQTIDGSVLSLKNPSGQSYNATFASLSGAGHVVIGSGILTCANTVDRTFSGAFLGSGSIIKKGIGSWTISGNNTEYTGIVTIQEGCLKLDHLEAMGKSRVLVSGGILDLHGYSLVNDIAQVAGEIQNSGSIASTLSSSIHIVGPTIINAKNAPIILAGSVYGNSPLTLQGLCHFQDDCDLDADVILNNADVLYHAKVFSYANHTYSIDASTVTLASSATLSLKGADFKINGGALRLQGAAIQIDDSYASSQARLSTDQGGSLMLEKSSTFSVPYAKTLEITLDILGSGSIQKTGLGTLKLSGRTLSAAEIQVNHGRLILAEDAASFGSESINLLNYSTVELSVDGETVVSRSITGQGHFVKSGAGTLIMNGAICFSGQVQADRGNLIFTGPVRLSSMSSTQIQSGATITYAGCIMPEGNAFLNLWPCDSQLIMDGAILSTEHFMGSSLTFGSALSAIAIQNNGLSIEAKKPVIIAGQLTGQGNLIKEGPANLTLKSIGSAYSGSIHIKHGSLTLQDSYANKSPLHIHANANLIWDISAFMLSTQEIEGSVGSKMIKRGVGAVRFVDTNMSDKFLGAIEIEKGKFQLGNTSLDARSLVTIYSGASLEVLHQGPSTSAILLPTVSIKRRSNLRLFIDTIDNRSVNNRIQIFSLFGENGSTLSIPFDPEKGEPGFAQASSAPLKIKRLSTANGNRDKIFLQVRAASDRPLTPGRVYALIQPNGETSVEQMIQRLRFMPSIAYPYAAQANPDTTNSAMRYGNLLYNSEGIFMKIGSAEQTGFYAGAIYATNLEQAAPPPNAYYQNFGAQFYPIADDSSTLYQFFQSYGVYDCPQLSLLMPQSNLMFRDLSVYTDSLSHTVLRLCRHQDNKDIILLHQNLNPQTHIVIHKNSMMWDKELTYVQRTQQGRYLQETQAHIIGGSLELARGHMGGYQYAQLHEYTQEVAGDFETETISKEATVQSQHTFHKQSWENNVTLIQREITIDRGIALDLGDYIESWNASSAHKAYGIATHGGVCQDIMQTSNFKGSLGFCYQGAVISHDGYQEQEANELNLRIRGYTSYQYQIEPIVAGYYHWESSKNSGAIYAKVGVQTRYAAGTQTICFVAHSQATIQHVPPIETSKCYTWAIESIFGLGSGITLSVSTEGQHALQTLVTQYTHRAILSYCI